MKTTFAACRRPHPSLSGRWTLLCALGLFLLQGQARAISPWNLLINTNNVVNITNYAANVTNADNSPDIQAAINAAAAGGETNGLSGGTVEIPAGTWLSGPVTMQSGVNLQLDTGALLRMLPFAQYPGGATSPPNFISGSSVHDVEFSGTGAIDGQGAPWWAAYGADNTVNRPIMIDLSSVTRLLVQNITLSNSPEFHLAVSGGKSVTVNGMIVTAPPSTGVANPSHNTDACDVTGTNILVENCNISTGDDDFTCSGGTHDVLITNNVYGTGHGISVGSYTDGGVSNLTVINCTMNGTTAGVRIKTDNDRGGLVQNISYLNISMTNVGIPIQVYGYYNEVGTPNNITPSTAASEPVAAVTGATPIFRNILFSNITATAVSGNPLGIIWARTELPATNIVFDRINVTAPTGFCLYNVQGAQFIDCNLTPSSGNTFEMFDAQAIVTNSAPTNSVFSFDGLTTSSYGNGLALYNAVGSMNNATVLGGGPLTLSASTLTVNNNLTLAPSSVFSYTLGSAPATAAVTGNLSLAGTNDIFTGPGFTTGTYTLMTYTGALSGNLPTLGTVPPNYACVLNTNTPGQVNLAVSTPNNASVAGLYFQQQPSNNIVGATLTPPVTVVATNVSGMPVTNAIVTVSLAGGANALNGTLFQVTGNNGTATFGNLSVTANGLEQLQAAVGAITTLSAPFNITNPPAINRTTVALVDSLSSPQTADTNLINASVTVSPGADTLVVLLATKAGSKFSADPTSLAWNSQTLTQAVTATDGLSTYRNASIYYLYNPVTDGAAHTITGSAGSGTVYWELKYLTLSGVDTTTAPLIGSTGGGSGMTSLGFSIGSCPSNGWAAVCANSSAPTGYTINFTGTGGTTNTVSDYLNSGGAGSAVGMGYISGLAPGTDNFTAAVTNKAAFSAVVFTPAATTMPSTQPTNIMRSLSGNTLTLSWPSDHIGWRLQVQTNGLLSASWVDVPGAVSTNEVSVTINPGIPDVFYRMVYP